MGEQVTTRDLTRSMAKAMRAVEVQPEPIVAIKQGMTRRERMMKRAIDIAGAGFALFLALPVMLMVMLAIKLESKGPIFFKQRRVGEGGKFFMMYKFRSMVVNAEALQTTVNKTTSDGKTLHKHKD
ncbi:MAG: sugar transferase, partial [Chloroflexota bacterium]|nr:sugar transferase [Chloroflexota bacterium]